GQAATEEDITPPIIGIVPHGRACEDIDPNHATVLRLPAEWVDTTKYTFQVIDAIAAQAPESGRALAVLFGGGDEEKKAVFRCANPRRDWPIVVIKGSVGLADQIAEALAASNNGTVVTDPDLRRITEDASIFTASIDGDIDDIRHLILGRIAPRSESARAILEDTWMLFNQLDRAAIARQRRFRRLELALVWLAV